MKTLLLVCCLLWTAAAYVDYSGDQVLRVQTSDLDQLQLLQDLSQRFDFWHDALQVGQHADVHVRKAQVATITSWLQSKGFDFSVMIPDVGELIAQQRQARAPEADRFTFDYYRTLEQLEQWIDDIAAEFPDLVTVSQIATSYEGRPIRLLKISSGPGRPVFWMDSGIHSREWVAPASNIYYTDRLLRLYGSDPEVTDLIDNMDFYIIPIWNVDGYAYTWTEDRLWRKTRSPNAGVPCDGTDPNRNWDYKWAEVATGGPCTNTYPGVAPWSEIEVREVAAYMFSIKDRLFGVLSIHAYGEMYMAPRGFTYEPNPDFEFQMSVCNEANDALRKVNGVSYRCDSLINLVGANSGSSVDWVYEILGVRLSFGVELRDRGFYGFILPEEQILPTATENFEAVKVFAKAALEESRK